MVFGIIFLVGIVIAIVAVFVRKFDPSNPNSVVNSTNTPKKFQQEDHTDQPTSLAANELDTVAVPQNQLNKKTEELFVQQKKLDMESKELDEAHQLLAKKTAELEEANAQISALTSKIQELQDQELKYYSHVEALHTEISSQALAIDALRSKIEYLQENEYIKDEALRARTEDTAELRNTIQGMVLSLSQEIKDRLDESAKTSTRLLHDIQDRLLCSSYESSDETNNISATQTNFGIDEIFFADTDSSEDAKEFQEELNKMTLQEVDIMDGYKFEQYIARLFNSLGFSAKATPKSRDFGVDVVAQNEYVHIGIQCKLSAHEKIDLHAIQEIVAGIKYRKLDIGMVITNNYFYQSARELAYKTGTVLWDRDTLARKIRKIKNRCEDINFNE